MKMMYSLAVESSPESAEEAAQSGSIHGELVRLGSSIVYDRCISGVAQARNKSLYVHRDASDRKGNSAILYNCALNRISP